MKTYWLLNYNERLPFQKPQMPAMPTPQQEVEEPPLVPVREPTPVKPPTPKPPTPKPPTPKVPTPKVPTPVAPLPKEPSPPPPVSAERRCSPYSPITFQDVARRSIANSPDKMPNSSRSGKYGWVKWDQFWK